MQRLVVQHAERTTSERLESLKRNIDISKGLFSAINFLDLPELANRVAHFSLLEHVKRFERSIEDVQKRKHLDGEYKNVGKIDLTLDEEKISKELKTELEELKGKINASLQALPKPELKEEATTVLVAGAGPVGYHSAVSFLREQTKHHSNVVLLADKYADMPTRGGKIDDEAMQDYTTSLGLIFDEEVMMQLMRFITLRPQAFYSIKHMDILGRATCLAMGGNIVNGTLDWRELKVNEDSQYVTAHIAPLQKEEKSIVIPEVRCILNAMGAHATYPDQIHRIDRVHEEKEQILRTHCAQVNVNLSPNTAEKISQINDYYESKDNLWLLFMSGQKFGSKVCKTQIYPILTKKESDILDEVIQKQFQLELRTDLDEQQKNEIRIVLKTLLFVEFIGDEAKIDMKIEDAADVTFRDQIKHGKQQCREFQIPQPSAPPQKVINLLGTKTVMVSVGAAALPPILNGEFVPKACMHADAVISHLVTHNFQPGSLEKTLAGEIFNKWMEQVNQFVVNQRNDSKDSSERMKVYFAQKYQLDAKSTTNIMSELGVKATEVSYPLANQNNMAVTSKMDVHSEVLQEKVENTSKSSRINVKH